MSVFNHFQNKLIFLPHRKYVGQVCNKSELWKKSNVFIHATSGLYICVLILEYKALRMVWGEPQFYCRAIQIND